MDFFTDILASPELQNALITLIGIVLTLIINRLASTFEAATGLRVEQNARDALHSAIRSGVEAALEEGPEAGIDEVKRRAVIYAQRSVPDAIRRLVPGDGVLDQLALRYYREAILRAGIELPQ